MLTPARRCARRLVRDACAAPSRPPLEPGTQQRAALSPHTRSCGVHLASGHRASRCPVSLQIRELLRGDSVYKTRPRTRGTLVCLWSADAAAAAIVEASAYRARGLPQGPEEPVPLGCMRLRGIGSDKFVRVDACFTAGWSVGKVTSRVHNVTPNRGGVVLHATGVSTRCVPPGAPRPRDRR